MYYKKIAWKPINLLELKFEIVNLKQKIIQGSGHETFSQKSYASSQSILIKTNWTSKLILECEDIYQTWEKIGTLMDT